MCLMRWRQILSHERFLPWTESDVVLVSHGQDPPVLSLSPPAPSPSPPALSLAPPTLSLSPPALSLSPPRLKHTTSGEMEQGIIGWVYEPGVYFKTLLASQPL